ncbi:tbc domain-containing [Cryptosporidium sp. chipmunk genotype I]|uniref:tbc domain-containing n=1 Tax=Cryptosporidium sp. chipmunk genotype I TaxID=1280935 RepID=UPI00351A716B|nr:tbc domain-containing [Cryptosporidium sp. chipmunk genotype I]
MELKEETNIVTLLAVKKAYNYFVPSLSNAKEMQFSKNEVESESESEPESGSGKKQEETVMKESRRVNSDIKKKTYEKKRLSFVRFLKLDKVEPHCDCDKDNQGRCMRMQNWLEISKSNELGLTTIYRELINIIEYIVRMEGNDIIEIDLTADGVINRIFSNRVMNSIYMDVCRTYPSISYFKYEGKSYLSKILLIYSLMDIDVGYVQGMNFLVGCILWHSSSEEHAFELLVSLMFNYGMREMFVSGLPGLRVKCRILDQLMEKELHIIWDHIIRQGGTIDMLATDWFLTLFSYSIPLNIIGKFWDDFFQQGWVPLYKLILYRLQRIESNILCSNDIADIMNAIKYSTPATKNGIFGNTFLNLRDELGKSNMIRFFNNLNSLFSNNTSTGSGGNKVHDFEFSDSDIVHEYGDHNVVNHSNLTNDPNIISLPHVWSELITESQFEIDLDVDYVQEMELKYSSNSSDDCIEFYKDNTHRDRNNIHTNSADLNMQSFEYFLDNDEIKEKEEQDEEQPAFNTEIADFQDDDLKCSDSPNSCKNGLNPEQNQPTQNLEADFAQETDVNHRTIGRYKEYYKGIMTSIFEQSDYSSRLESSTDITSATNTCTSFCSNKGNSDCEATKKQSTNRSMHEIRDKLESSLEKLLSITEVLLIKSINKEHLKELSIKCKEIQKNKFGPWSYQH